MMGRRSGGARWWRNRGGVVCALAATFVAFGCGSSTAGETRSLPALQRVASAEAPASSNPPSRPPLRYPRDDRPWLGVVLEDRPASAPGVTVVRVLPGSPAEGAGLRAADVLLSIDGGRVDEPRAVASAVAAVPIGRDVPLFVLRGGQERIFRARIEGTPEFEDQLRLAFVGQVAPSIDGVVTFQGSAASLRDLRGKVVVLEFWASWCAVCRYLSPVLDDWHRTYRPAGLEVVGVTTDGPARGAEVAARESMSYTLMSDAAGEVTEAYLASQVPTVFLLDRRGVIVDVMVGLDRKRTSEMRAELEGLLDAD